MTWKKGRGRLGALDPLLGIWVAETSSDMGSVRCERRFERALDGAYVQLRARWEVGARPPYEELALFGVDADKRLRVWSFTTDGKQSVGTAAAAPDLHAQALAFEAQMPAGLARMAYWPDPDIGEDGLGFVFVVESRNKRGWNRFVEHRYRPAG